MSLTRIDENSSNDDDEGDSNVEPSSTEHVEFVESKPSTPVESRPRPPTPLEDMMVGVANGITALPPLPNVRQKTRQKLRTKTKLRQR